MESSDSLCIDLNAKDNEGRTAYCWACTSSFQATKELIRKNAEILKIDLEIENFQTCIEEAQHY